MIVPPGAVPFSTFLMGFQSTITLVLIGWSVVNMARGFMMSALIIGVGAAFVGGTASMTISEYINTSRN